MVTFRIFDRQGELITEGQSATLGSAKAEMVRTTALIPYDLLVVSAKELPRDPKCLCVSIPAARGRILGIGWYEIGRI